MRIVSRDNFNREGPNSNEEFVNLPSMTEQHAMAVCQAINDGFPQDWPRYYATVPNDYKLWRFEP